MTKEEIIKKLRDMARYPTVTLPRDTEALRTAADLLEQAEQELMAYVYKATTQQGEVAYFGVKSTARAWAKSGTVEFLPLKTLELVQTDVGIGKLEQEPVAWSYWQSCLNDDETQTAPWVHRLSEFKPSESIINKDIEPLYTSLPQRQWVELTYEEVESWDLPEYPTVFEFVRFIEHKIKDKNT